MFSRPCSLILPVLFASLLITSCKSDKSFDFEPIAPEKGIFEARGVLTPLDGGITALDFAYISGEKDALGQDIVASTSTDYVTHSPYKTIIGRLGQSDRDLFSIAIQSREQFDSGSMIWGWSEQEIEQLFLPGDTLLIGFGPGEAIVGVAHAGFDLTAGPAYTSPSENKEGINVDGPGFVIIEQVEPYSATANDITRDGLRTHVRYQCRLNGVAGLPDFWAAGTAVLFFEY